MSKYYQRINETVAEYVTRLKMLGKEILEEYLLTAKNEEKPGLIKKNKDTITTQFQSGLRKELKRTILSRLIGIPELTIKKAEEIAKQRELCEDMLNGAINRMSTLNVDVFKKWCSYCRMSSTALVAQLQQTKQGNLNIDDYDYRRSIESSMAYLTIAQAGDNGEAIATFRKANEKIAIDVFTRDIRNREVWTVTRARNFEFLSKTINAAKEESVVDEQNSIF
ncbi:hypothetical protein FQA39_LY16425 [Lamprigera yunnana]|nr:hypothetical protein FQA39_LY16425 [Lamprigera yunnana]